MTNAETIWNVISWYYGNSTAIGLMLVLMTVYLLERKKEYRYYTFSCAVLMFLIFLPFGYFLRSVFQKSLDIPGQSVMIYFVFSASALI